MNTTVINTYAEAFSANVVMLSQQKDSRFKSRVTVQDIPNAKAGYVPALNALSGRKISSRLEKVSFSDAQWTNTRIPVDGYSITIPVDDIDTLETVYDINSEYVMGCVAELNRLTDKAIIDAALGDAYRGSASDLSPVALPATQTIAVNYTGNGGTPANKGLTVTKLIAAKKILLENESVEMGDQMFFAHGAEQVGDLLTNDSQLSDIDFSNVKRLEQGDINSFMGFEFVRSTQLPLDASDYRTNFAYCKSGIRWGNQKDISAEIQPRYDLDGAYQIRADFYGGAARVDDKKVVSVVCDESI